MKNRISVKRAVELLRLSELSVRVGIEKGRLQIGIAIHTSKNRTTYHISPNKLYEYLGLKDEMHKNESPISVTDFKVKLLEERVQELEKTVNELKTVISGLVDNQEYIIKRMNGENIKGYSITFNSAIMNFRKKPIYKSPEKTVTVKRAAELLGISPLTIHWGIINGKFPFGTVTQKALYNGNHHNGYHIIAEKLAEYLAISLDEL